MDFQEKDFLRKIRFLFCALSLTLVSTVSAWAQSSRPYPFRAVNYEVEATLHPEDQTLSAKVKVDFVAESVSRTLVIELHHDLRVTSVRTPGGPPLTFERDLNSPLLLTVALPEAVATGHQVSVTFEYSGPVSSEEDSPTKGLRFASIDKSSAYLLLPARWFPLTNYPSNRYTGTFKITVPDSFAVVGTGKPEGTNMVPASGNAGARAEYVFRCEHPSPAGSFVAGSLQLAPVQSEGLSINVYAPPAQASTSSPYAEALTHILSYFEDAFGPLGQEPSFTVAQMPDGSVSGYSAPGLLLISARQWSSKTNTRLLSRLAAGQWWGDRVLPATASDVWLTDGFSRYAEAMYAEQSDGVASLHKALEEFAVGAEMYEDVTPISQAARLEQYSDNYHSVVEDKGAMVFHMLRSELGDDAFESLLREFYKKYTGKTASLAEFEKMASTKVPPPQKGQPPLNLLAFFSQWLNSTGVPEFKLEYIVYRTPKGFKVVGKLRQELDTFRMPVDVRVDTEGNPEFKKILVTGTTSDFQIETFGRPKPNGVIIDPNNNLLKSSPKLRVHAAVARGEGLAEIGKYYEAIQEYQHALDLQSSNSLAHFRMGEAMFYQKNYNAAANAFRSALGGDLDPKWIDVWSHIYIGKIYDLLSQRERAVNEYQLAQHTNDDTAGAQQEVAKYMKQPFSPDGSAPPAAAAGAAAATDAAAPVASPPAPANSGSSDMPTLKKRPPNN
jgi:aminopeptidase N